MLCHILTSCDLELYPIYFFFHFITGSAISFECLNDAVGHHYRPTGYVKNSNNPEKMKKFRFPDFVAWLLIVDLELYSIILIFSHLVTWSTLVIWRAFLLLQVYLGVMGLSHYSV